jgi:molecular chaperone GrpE
VSKKKQDTADQVAKDDELIEKVAAAATEAAEQAEADEAASDESQSETMEVGVAEFEKLHTENRELKERIIRQQADFDNIRKRLRREADQAGSRQLASFIRPLLVEMDNFEHALNAAKPEHFQDFAMGVTMVRENILGILGHSGIEVVPCEGVFDPAWHEVIAECEDPDKARGTILEVHRQGYRLGEQVIRAAQVVVSRPPADPQPEADADADSDQESE